MAPQKRKHPHDAGPDPGADPSIPDAPPRRSTRQHPDGSIAEPEHQLRSGRVRANTIEKSSGAEVARTTSRGRKADAPKSKPKTSSTDPAVATIPTRTTRHHKVTTATVSPVSPVSKENVRPPTPPDDRERRVSQSKQSHHRAHTRSRSPPQLEPPSSSISQSRTHAPISSQRPARPTRPIPKATSPELAPTATAIAITPKRTPSNKNKITKPPGTPRSDRNIDKIVFGKTCFKAWYPSYYGKEVLGDVSANVGGGNAKMGGGKRDPPMLDRLYICPCCFKYSKEVVPWWKHVKYLRVPYTNSTPASPIGISKGKGKSRGNESDQSTNDDIASEGEWSVWEVDGEKDGLFCQNLSLFAKLFLDNKSVFFDVTGFNYFLLVYTPPAPRKNPVSPIRIDSAPQAFGDSDILSPIPSNPQVDTSTSLSSHPRPQIVGFFSKEQMSWDNNNLACILVFPPWQRKGLGALLMGVSYEISRREGILGGPEKPISELGRKGYKRFWAGEITRWILELDVPAPSTEPTHASRHTRREKEKEKEKDRGKDKAREQEGLIVDVEQCSRDTWIVPEDCLAVLREMGVVEEAGLGTPKDGRGTDINGSGDTNIHGKEKEEKEPKLPLVPRVRIDKAAVRSWARENRIDLTRACDPNGFVEGARGSESGSGEVRFKECNISSWEQQKAAFQAVHEEIGHIDVVVANAGITEGGRSWLVPPSPAKNPGELDELDEPRLKVLDVNLTGNVYSVKLALHYMQRNAPDATTGLRGSIICTASNTGLYPFPPQPLYSASKHAIIGLVRSLGAVYGQPHIGIRINALAPAVFETNISSNSLFKKMVVTPPSTLVAGVEKLMTDTSLNGQVAEIHGQSVTLRPPHEVVDADSEFNLAEFTRFGYGL
ncbi:hypothetical protein GQX73_g7337 [Xylaria multiplex]|uniref:MYST-type HAT domain-containing protein n=1 Tax=Xylaria multiplex TaxID=323545 RepID=A0A7C8INM4_9PEZI|nr:hypothetical protein GQX73_g7337 [Xylaria multiplex]